MAEDTVTVEGKVGRAGMGWRAGWWAWGHGATGMDGDCALGSGGHPPMPYPHTHSEAVSAVRSPHHLTALRDGKAPICSGPRF